MNRQKIRFLIQTLCLALTVIGFFINFSWTMGIIMLTIVIGGTFYCGWVCPFGTMQEFSSKLSGALKIKKRRMPKRLHGILKYTRYIIFLLVGITTLPIIMDIMAYEPRTSFMSLLGGNLPTVLALVVIVLFAGLSMVYERFYCKYLCFEGAKYGLIGLLRPVTIHRNTETCINCGKCNTSCSMNIEVSQFEVLRSPNCINCFKCLDVCPIENTLEYSFKPKKLMNKSYRLLLTSLIIIIPIGAIFVSGKNREANASDVEVVVLESNVEVEVLESNVEVDVLDSGIGTIEQQGNYLDGTYEGVGIGFKGNIYVEVIIESGHISQITVTDHNDDRKWYNRAVSIIDDIIGEQSTEVELVSGATYSSSGIREAVIEALEKAK